LLCFLRRILITTGSWGKSYETSYHRIRTFWSHGIDNRFCARRHTDSDTRQPVVGSERGLHSIAAGSHQGADSRIAGRIEWDEPERFRNASPEAKHEKEGKAKEG
jgi:hypothetical protein